MDSETIQNALRDPTPEAASEVLASITPDIIGDLMPAIFAEVDSGQESAVFAANTLDQIFTVVETEVLGESVDFVIDRFGDRIIDMLTGETMLSIFERGAMRIGGN